MTEIEKRRLPAATLKALNTAAFEVRGEWAKEASRVFDRPTSLTLGAPLYRKATLANLQAEVFIRDEATKGTPPATYLQAQVRGGARRRKRSEIALERSLGFPPFWVPGRAAPLDAFGNIKRGILGRILSQLQANNDVTQRETPLKRGRRLRRQRRRGGGGSYFVAAADQRGLKRGIVYERIVSAFGSTVRPILIGVSRPPRYSKRYDVFKLAQDIFARRFKANFEAERSIATRGRL